MSALRALLAAMPDICRTLDQIDPRWHEMAFAALIEAAQRDGQAPQHIGYDSVAPTYDPSHTSVMPAYREDLGTR